MTPVAPVIVISETTGQPYKEDNFRHVFARIRAAAIDGNDETGRPPCKELDGLWFLDLRRTAVVRLAEAGTPES